MNSTALPNPNAVGTILENIAKRRSSINYGNLANQLGLPPMVGEWKAHPLSKIFEILDQQDANANRPFRTSVVVSADTNEPGKGFFEALERLKGTPIPNTSTGRTKVWLAELGAAHLYSWP